MSQAIRAMYNVINLCNIRCKNYYYNPGMPLKTELTLEETHNYMRGAGTFKQAIDAIRIIKDNEIKVYARMTATKKSQNNVEPLAKCIADLNIDSLSAAQSIPIYNAMAHKDVYAER